MSVKDIVVKPIARADAQKIIRQLHYSGKTNNNSQVFFGIFLDGRCGGALAYGPSLDKSKTIGLVQGTKWNDYLELNRAALAEWMPKNSESRAISVSLRLLKKAYPNLKWVISFADGMQCGHGTIYQACNFLLTGYSSGSMLELPDDLAKLAGSKYAHRMSLQTKSSELSREVLRRTGGKNMTNEAYAQMFGGKVLEGYMFRYVYFLDPTWSERLTVPVLPYSKISELGGDMYRGQPMRDKC